MQLWKMQNISEFKSLWKRPRVILIEKHFKPICSRITFTTQSATKAMIRELGNVELFELCEIFPKVQCSHCLLHWNQGIVCCICGQCLGESDSRRKFNKTKTGCTLYPALRDWERALSWCSTRQNRRTERAPKAWNAWKRCCKKVDSQGGHFTGIHDRFPRESVYRESHLAIGWTEQNWKEMDEVAKGNYTYHLSTEEFKRYQGPWYLTLIKAGKNGPMKLRSDFRSAVLMKSGLSHESGEQVAEPISPPQFRKWHPSSSASWWDKSEWNWWSS